MFGLSQSATVSEVEASGDLERVYHEIRQTLRVTGVNLIFRKWGAQQGLLPAIWRAMQPIAELAAFESAADQLRREAAELAREVGRLDAASAAQLGESQAFQVQRALELYHYINPKLLLFNAVVRLALAEERSANAGESSGEVVEAGWPSGMYPMEMEDEQPEDARLQEVFSDIKQTLGLEIINSDYRTLALWPDYLTAVWQRLKPLVQLPHYEQVTGRLREAAQQQALSLPHPAGLSRQLLSSAGIDASAAAESSQKFEQLLPGLIINVALCLQDWRSLDEMAHSPFPASRRKAAMRERSAPESST